MLCSLGYHAPSLGDRDGGGLSILSRQATLRGATALLFLVTIPLAKDLQVPQQNRPFLHEPIERGEPGNQEGTHGIKTSLQLHANHYHGTNSTVPNWDCARERDTTQPPALHDYLLGPANKSGAFFTEPASTVRRR